MSKTGYVLKLESGKYYIGTTSDLSARFAEHCSGIGSRWTEKYPPVELVKTFPMKNGTEEDRITLEYMKKYGIDAVRGGSYTNVDLTDDQMVVLVDRITPVRGNCHNCGLKGHHAADCDSHTEMRRVEKRTAEDRCFRCGRVGHFASSCYARSEVSSYGYEYEYEYEDGDYDDDDAGDYS